MHRGAIQLLLVGSLTPGMGGSVAAAATAPETGSVHVQRQPSFRRDVPISFQSAGQLPEHGYYYAVIVLRPYERYTRRTPPPCATSSNMERTDYGYPAQDGAVRLTLTPTASATHHWCRGGSYIGAIYAVPHAPPCESKYPCRSEPYEPPSPCWEIDGRQVCGVVALPRQYEYPDGLPKPLASGTRIVGRFSVVFR